MPKLTMEQSILFETDMPIYIKRQALAVLLLREGIELKKIAAVVGVSARQVYNYRKKAEEEPDHLYEDHHYRPKSRLSEHHEIIKRSLVEQPVATAKATAERIYQLTGIKRSPTQVRTLLHQLGLKPRRVASIPAKANPDTQKSFLETELEPRIGAAQKGERVLLFADAAHFVWQLYIGVLWCLTRIFIPAASGRKRINVLGAYDPIANTFIQIVNRTYITAETVCTLLDKARLTYFNKEITIVLDNASYQRCKIVKEKAAALGIELLFLPTYSPNLNLIERLWQFVKKECLYSKHYDSADDFEAAIVHCLNEVSLSKAEKVKSLMTLKFQLFDVNPFAPPLAA